MHKVLRQLSSSSQLSLAQYNIIQSQTLSASFCNLSSCLKQKDGPYDDALIQKVICDVDKYTSLLIMLLLTIINIY